MPENSLTTCSTTGIMILMSQESENGERLGVRLPPDLMSKLKTWCSKNRVKLSDAVRKAIKALVDS